MRRRDRRWMAHPAHEWMWGPDGPPDDETDTKVLTVAFAAAVVVIAFVAVLLVGGAVGSAIGFDMAALP